MFCPGDDIGGVVVIIDRVVDFIINPAILLLFAVGLLLFLWGLMMFMWQSDSDTGRETGKQHMIYGIIGMFVMVSAFGIIMLIMRTVGSCGF